MLFSFVKYPQKFQGCDVGVIDNILSSYQFDVDSDSDLSGFDFFLQMNVVIHVSYLQKLGNVYPRIPDSFDFLQ